MLLEHAREADYPAIIALVNAAYRGGGAVESWYIESGDRPLRPPPYDEERT